MSCSHDCPSAPVFPIRITNRPGLSTTHYRIGDYGSFREHMLAQLDKSQILSGWTHRGSDDPGIALVECAATVAEILAFYQNLYSNETLLRTARWRESVSRLVQLSGYRMAPGVAGKATFALTVEGDEAVTVPAGFGFKAELDGIDDPVIFESIEATVAYPAQSTFSMYRPRKGLQPVTAGLTSLELHSVEGAEDLASLNSTALKPGDRLMLLPELGPFEYGGISYTGTPQAKPEIAIVKQVERVLNRIIVHFEGALSIPRNTLFDAYVISRSFRHFGHNAPSRVGRMNPNTGVMTMELTNFVRDIYASTSGDSGFYSALGERELPLDQELDDLALGSKLICHGDTEFNNSNGLVPFCVVREVKALRNDTLVWGGVSGSAAVVEMDDIMIANRAVLFEEADIRRLQIHEAVSPRLQFRAPSDWHSGPFTVSDSGYEIHYYGLLKDAQELLGRQILMQGADGRSQTLRVLDTTTLDSTGKDPLQPWMWPLYLDQSPLFDREWFSESAENDGNGKVTVHGNLIDADQGESQPLQVVGSGDARQTFLTLPIPKMPLTFQLLSEVTPPQVPVIDVYVDGIRWNQVDSLFHAQPKDRVYVIRQDEQGNSYVQCGDGITGAVFPSGRNNIQAQWRKGVGARGNALNAPKATAKLKPLKKIDMIEPAVGGADPETAESARDAAPARMQSLGRLVGLADFEAEALSLPGVLKARSDWVAPSGTPRIDITVLTESGDSAALNQVRQSLIAANQCRGASRHPVQVNNGVRKFVAINLTAGFDPQYRSEDLEKLICEALGSWGLEGDYLDNEGLFGLANRKFGEGAHVSQVLAAVQNVQGVNWVRTNGFQLVPQSVPLQPDPVLLSAPMHLANVPRIDCTNAEILSLYEAHLTMNLSADIQAEECRV